MLAIAYGWLIKRVIKKGELVMAIIYLKLLVSLSGLFICLFLLYWIYRSYYLINLLNVDGKPEKFLTEVERDEALIYYYLGEVYQKKGKTEAAKENFKKSFKLEQNSFLKERITPLLKSL